MFIITIGESQTGSLTGSDSGAHGRYYVGNNIQFNKNQDSYQNFKFQLKSIIINIISMNVYTQIFYPVNQIKQMFKNVIFNATKHL